MHETAREAVFINYYSICGVRKKVHAPFLIRLDKVKSRVRQAAAVVVELLSLGQQTHVQKPLYHLEVERYHTDRFELLLYFT